MHPRTLLALALLALALLAGPALSPAQERPPAAPADAPAASALAYRPAFDHLPRGVVAPRDTTPGNDTAAWRAANDTVGRHTRGHSDVLRWERAHPDVRVPPAEERP